MGLGKLGEKTGSVLVLGSDGPVVWGRDGPVVEISGVASGDGLVMRSREPSGMGWSAGEMD
ncbi:hypothetical protein Pyn_14018 [Prunus yedoensis var. nudiflora]|uniref:Uncharacterized protein n=1 Tax=Prunus yedoensis var. nudiflora TaxID=2094558 RepID=A0A314YYB3_PRUYE|nr:hypothetical protein Pyn_14018 [Prunus yedoensis var. nudiflora]